MSRPAGLDQGLATEWDRALQDAGFSASEVCLWLAEGSPCSSDAPGGQYFMPWRAIDGQHGLSEAQLEEAMSEQCEERHRFVLRPEFITRYEFPADVSVAGIGAVMRHELEHARQHEALGPNLHDLDGVVDHILSLKAGGLWGARLLLTMKPIEQDANAAAAIYLQRHHQDAVELILRTPDIAHLARSRVGPESADTLMRRMACFLYLYRDVCERDVEGKFPFASKLEVYSKEAAETWRRLEDLD
jgi:hypothetical protein